jgi:signal transduction histidine kinase
MPDRLPRGDALPDALWHRRHRALVALLWAHVPALVAVALLHGLGPVHAALEGGAVALFGAGALAARRATRRVQALVVVLGLLTASAVLVHITGGLIEAHFHFFVVVGIVSLYEDWVPFVTAVVYVLVQHLAFATVVDHEAVFNHPGPAWKWSAIHSGAIGALALALLANWREADRRREELAAAQRRQEGIFHALDEGVLVVDRDGSVIDANPSARRLLGSALPERPARDGFEAPWTAVLPDGRELRRDERPVRAAARTGRSVVDLEVELRRPDGPPIWVRTSAIPILDGPDDPGPYPVVMSFVDVTARRSEQAALERSNADLRQFAYVASHDLSEPLRMITSYLELLRRRYADKLGPDADEFMRHAMDGAERMRSLIEDLLSYSRAGREAAHERVDLAEVADAVLTDLEPAIADAAADLHVGELPVVTGDAVKLRQLLQNLVANALKFRRGPGVQVWVEAVCTEDRWAISVADDGIGIPPAQRERVFDMFGRVAGREAYDGTGIGLAICRRIVELHGGRIEVGERPGGGTVFRFTLPLSPA